MLSFDHFIKFASIRLIHKKLNDQAAQVLSDMVKQTREISRIVIVLNVFFYWVCVYLGWVYYMLYTCSYKNKHINHSREILRRKTHSGKLITTHIQRKALTYEESQARKAGNPFSKLSTIHFFSALGRIFLHFSAWATLWGVINAYCCYFYCLFQLLCTTIFNPIELKNCIIPPLTSRCNATLLKMLLRLLPLTCPSSIPTNGNSHLVHLSASLQVLL